jgi:hypothetical protein
MLAFASPSFSPRSHGSSIGALAESATMQGLSVPISDQAMVLRPGHLQHFTTPLPVAHLPSFLRTFFSTSNGAIGFMGQWDTGVEVRCAHMLLVIIHPPYPSTAARKGGAHGKPLQQLGPAVVAGKAHIIMYTHHERRAT